MNELSSIAKPETLRTLFDLLRDNPASTTLTAVGVILLIIGVFAAASVLKAKPDEVRPWQKLLLFGSLGLGVVLAVAGPALSLAAFSSTVGKGFASSQVPPAAVIQRLRDNAEVKWLIRLIPHDSDKQPELRVARLTHLGAPGHRYVFVADYEELRGHTVAEAVQRVGGSLRAASRVTAIIFPLQGRQLFPASARGLLQVVRELDAGSDPNKQNYVKFQPVTSLSDRARADLDKSLDLIKSWSWENYGEHYRDFCLAAQRFRCEKSYGARLLMGDVSRDWHPLGFSRRSPPNEEPCAKPETACAIDTWDQVTPLRDVVGSRAFLIGNMDFSTIDGRVMIDFHEPRLQVIPDLGVGK